VKHATDFQRPPTIGSRLRRALLGKAWEQSFRHYAGSDEYWNEAISAELGWPRSDAPPQEQSEYEPVYGMTPRQLEEWLAHNPQLRPEYEDQLRRLKRAPEHLTSPTGAKIPKS
jgi:hypothetical protein